MPLPTLPPEILASIITELPRTKDLRACCRVSKAFLAHAQAALFRHLRVLFSLRTIGEEDSDSEGYNSDDSDGMPSPTLENSVTETNSRALELTLLTHPHLGRLVRSLSAESNVGQYPESPPRLPALVVAVVLRCCPNLEHLAIRQEQDAGLAGILDVVRLICPSLKKLSITSRDPLKGVARQALAELTTLEHLDIRTGRHKKLGHKAQSSHLTSLTLEVERRSISPEMLSYYAQSSASSLRTIRLAFDWFDLDLSPFTNLNSVTFRFIMRREEGDADHRSASAEKLALSLRRAGPQVRHLTLGSAAGTNHEYQSGMIIRLLSLLPPSLTSLDISSYSISAADLLPFLQPSTSPSLRLLVVCGIDSTDRSPIKMSKVVKAGAARGVVVEVTRCRVTEQ